MNETEIRFPTEAGNEGEELYQHADGRCEWLHPDTIKELREARAVIEKIATYLSPSANEFLKKWPGK